MSVLATLFLVISLAVGASLLIGLIVISAAGLICTVGEAFKRWVRS